MKILYLNHNVAWTGGTFLRALPFAVGLVERGHRVTLLTISPTRRVGFSRTEHRGVQLVETPDLLWGRGRSGWDPWDVINRIVDVRRTHDWDIVHSWDCRPAAILPALAARRRGSATKLVTDWADWWSKGGTQRERPGAWMRLVWPLETFFEERFRQRADGTTAISQLLRERAVTMGVPADRTLLLPQGCHAVSVGSRAEARHRLGLPTECSLLVYLGRLNRSDADLLFDVVSQLLGRREDCRFVMIGRHGARIPAALSDHPRFSVTGVVSQHALDDYIAASDAAVVPLADTLAGRARWPSKINAFLSAGRAVVVTRVGDLPTRLEKTGAAIVTAPEAGAMVDGVEMLLEDGARRQQVEEASARVASGDLAWTALSGSLESFYRSL